MVCRIKLRTRLDGNLHRQFAGLGTGVQDRENVENISLLDAEFADDLMAFAENKLDLHILVKSLYDEMKKWGLQMSDKTELVTFGGTPDEINVGPFIVREADDTDKGGEGAGPGNFKYAGSTFSKNFELFREIELRMRSGWGAMGKFREVAWNVK